MLKIDMNAAWRDPLQGSSPIIPFKLAAFAVTLFAQRLTLGTTIAVGMLFCNQMKTIFTNKTSVESQVEEKAKDQFQYQQRDEVLPYDMEVDGRTLNGYLHGQGP